MRSGSAHCDLELAVEVRRCPLRFRSGKEEGEEEENKEKEKEKEKEGATSDKI